MVSLFIEFDTAFFSDEALHRYEGLTVGGHDNDLFFSGESASDSGELAEGRHEDGLVGKGTSELLLPHHETTISGDTSDLLVINEP